jgi:hypothetical protein
MAAVVRDARAARPARRAVDGPSQPESPTRDGPAFDRVPSGLVPLPLRRWRVPGCTAAYLRGSRRAGFARRRSVRDRQEHDLPLLLRFYEPRNGTITVDGAGHRELAAARAAGGDRVRRAGRTDPGRDAGGQPPAGRAGLSDQEIDARVRVTRLEAVLDGLPDGQDSSVGSRVRRCPAESAADRDRAAPWSAGRGSSCWTRPPRSSTRSTNRPP